MMHRWYTQCRNDSVSALTLGFVNKNIVFVVLSNCYSLHDSPQFQRKTHKSQNSFDFTKCAFYFCNRLFSPTNEILSFGKRFVWLMRVESWLWLNEQTECCWLLELFSFTRLTNSEFGFFSSLHFKCCHKILQRIKKMRFNFAIACCFRSKKNVRY